MFDSRRMFQAVSQACVSRIFFVVSCGHFPIVPGQSPTRGSGLGADVDMLDSGAGAALDDDDVDEELMHDTPASTAVASEAVHVERQKRDSDFTVDTGGGWGKKWEVVAG
jgi:hypothetical protein